MIRYKPLQEKKIQPVAFNIIEKHFEKLFFSLYTPRVIEKKKDNWKPGLSDQEIVELELAGAYSFEVRGNRAEITIVSKLATLLSNAYNLGDENDYEESSKFFKFISNIVEKFGWFVVKDDYHNIRHHFIIEKNYYGERIENVPSTIWHIAPTGLQSSILSKGLIPHKGTRDDYRYPPRVFLLKNYNEQDFNMLSFAIGTYGESIEDVYYGNVYIEPVTIFKIDTLKLNNGTKLFQDLDHKNGMWTYSPIPAKAIKVFKVLHDEEN